MQGLPPPKPPVAGACPNGAGAGDPNAGAAFGAWPNPPPPDDPNGVLDPNIFEFYTFYFNLSSLNN